MAGGEDEDGIRIEGVVPSKRDRDIIAQAAKKRNTSVRRFIGQSALREAESDQTLEMLSALVCRLEKALVGQKEAADRQEQMLRNHDEVLTKLSDLVVPVRHTCQVVERGEGTLNVLHGRVKCPEAMTAMMIACQQIGRLNDHFGLQPVNNPILEDFEKRGTDPIEEANEIGGPGKGKMDNRKRRK